MNADHQRCKEQVCDVLVVGGGVNGAGIARDLAGRGWRVVLVEQDDLASHTSGASTKLIHGGLRYLEYREFALVRKALQEREGLLRSAPHIMWPLRFVMPLDASAPAGARPAWLIRIGLFLYDHLARRRVLPGSHGVDLRAGPLGAPLQPQFERGFVYSDGWVDDARLVVLNAVDARERGATVLTRMRCTAARRNPDGADGWLATLRPHAGAESARAAAERTVRARVLVNAAGPWADAFLRGVAQPAAGETLATKSLRLVKGSHIVVPRCFDHDHAYIFQNADKRIIFAIPYEGDFTLIGTTDVEITGDPRGASASDHEVAYLCAQASRYFRKPVRPADVRWTYAGVRPLLDDTPADVPGNAAAMAASASAVSRDYLLEANTDGAPLLSVWGGKITTFRRLAEEAADDVCRLLGERRPAWTKGAALPGGDLSAWIGPARDGSRPDDDFERLVAAVAARHPRIGAALVRRLARAYGSRVDRVIAAGRVGGGNDGGNGAGNGGGNASDSAVASAGGDRNAGAGRADGRADGCVDADPCAVLGSEVAPGLHEAELRYLRAEEWAQTADDVLWRRSKLGLHQGDADRARVAAWMAAADDADAASDATTAAAGTAIGSQQTAASCS